MKNAMITFRSVTPAQRGEMLLRRNGFFCTLRRTPRWMQDKGCGYSLQIRAVDIDECIQLLRTNLMEFKRVYLIRENGAAEELPI